MLNDAGTSSYGALGEIIALAIALASSPSLGKIERSFAVVDVTALARSFGCTLGRSFRKDINGVTVTSPSQFAAVSVSRPSHSGSGWSGCWGLDWTSTGHLDVGRFAEVDGRFAAVLL